MHQRHELTKSLIRIRKVANLLSGNPRQELKKFFGELLPFGSVSNPSDRGMASDDGHRGSDLDELFLISQSGCHDMLPLCPVESDSIRHVRPDTFRDLPLSH